MIEKFLVAIIAIVACVFLFPIAAIVSLGKLFHYLWEFKSQVVLLIFGLFAVAAFSLFVAFWR